MASMSRHTITAALTAGRSRRQAVLLNCFCPRPVERDIFSYWVGSKKKVVNTKIELSRGESEWYHDFKYGNCRGHDEGLRLPRGEHPIASATNDIQG